MKKFAVPALTLILLALTLTACACAPASEGTAFAAENEYYIYVSPSDGTLAANATAQPSGIAVYDGSENFAFFLTESYYYKVSPITINGNTTYFLNSTVAALYLKGFSDDMLLTSLPEGVTAADALPAVTLTLAEGATIFERFGNLQIDSSNSSEYTLTFLGFAGYSEADGARMVAFSADNGSDTTYGVAEASSFNEFSVAWHPVAAARREALLAPSDTGDGGEVDLTEGTPSNTLRIILIIGIAVPALLIVFLLFKPASDKGRSYDKRSMRGDTRRGIDYDRERSYDADRERYERGYRDYERRDYDYDRRDYPSDRRDYDGRDDGRRY